MCVCELIRPARFDDCKGVISLLDSDKKLVECLYLFEENDLAAKHLISIQTDSPRILSLLEHLKIGYLRQVVALLRTVR